MNFGYGNMNELATIGSLQSEQYDVRTPAYIYDLEYLKARVGGIRETFREQEIELLYATMANDLPEILQVMRNGAVGACVNSMKHLSLALSIGFDRSKIQFTSTGIPVTDLHQLQEQHIAVNLDSPRQLKNWFRNGTRAKAGLRINAASLVPDGKWISDRIGVAAESVPQIVYDCMSRDETINGLHVYLGTNFLSIETLLPRIERLFEIADEIPKLEYVNIGGGIGVDYSGAGREFPIQRYAEAIGDIVKRHRSETKRPLRVLVEPGRAMVATAAVYVTTVTDIKELNGDRFVAVDGSVATFPRPLHHPESLHAVVYVGNADGDLMQTHVVGRTTFSKDILSKCLLPKDLECGDKLVFRYAGAYSYSMSSRFLGQVDPEIRFLKAS